MADAGVGEQSTTLSIEALRALHETGRSFVADLDLGRVVQAVADGGPYPVIGGRYLDSFTVVGAEYWFRRRVAEVHLLGDSVGYLTANPWTG